jgi:hypothetical protein
MAAAPELHATISHLKFSSNEWIDEEEGEGGRSPSGWYHG